MNARPPPRLRGPHARWAGLAALPLAAALAGLGAGAAGLPPETVLRALGVGLGLLPAGAVDPADAAIFWQIRAPRVGLGLAVGAGLGAAGALMQGLFRNPLASPDLIGVSSGAALGAAAAIVLGAGGAATATGLLGLQGAAFLGGLLAAALAVALAGRAGRVDTGALLLAGIAVNALGGAGTGLLVTLADDAQLRSITFWSMGSLGGALPHHLAPAFLLSALLVALGVALGPALDALQLGEPAARHLGIRVETLKRVLVAATAGTVGAAVSLTGIIGFIGLVAPHLARGLLGPRHAPLVGGAALLGAALLVLADTAARTVAAPVELPLGVLTALGGAPFLLFLLSRARRAGPGV